jgi:ribosomal-protein-alanine N-acetyltransferase
MSADAVTIDAIGDADLDAVIAIETSSIPRGEASPPASRMREEMSRPWAKVWVARAADGAVRGFLLAWHVADELHVLDVATHVASRRRGVGRALVAHAIAFAAASAVRIVLLEVRRSNAAAIGLYRSAGFHALRVRRDYYPDHEDAIEMLLTLDPETGAVVRHDDEVRLDR